MSLGLGGAPSFRFCSGLPGHGSTRPADHSALFFAPPSPNSVVLKRAQCKLQALARNRTVTTNRFRQVDLVNGIAGQAVREKQVRVKLSAGRVLTPRTVIPRCINYRGTRRPKEISVCAHQPLREQRLFWWLECVIHTINAKRH
jgi:hypothetical protein